MFKNINREEMLSLVLWVVSFELLIAWIVVR
jgi:hypothetical protein